MREMPSSARALTEFLCERAQALGFELFGAASANDPMLASAIERYSKWNSAGLGATMEYLRRHTELKAHPERLLAGVKSVFCVGLLYGQELAPASDAARARVSLYTRGADYHELMRQKLDELAAALSKEHAVASRAFVDSEPVLERFWAWRAGLGWIGKNAMLINRKQGSYLFLGGLFIAADLEFDAPQPDHCGRCRKCIEACPTAAITPNREIESAKCIAYHTIENRGLIPENIMERSGSWIAGCDICQNVCPWNDPVTPSQAFEISNAAFNAPLEELAQWSADEFKTKLKGVAMARMKYVGFIRNVAIAIGNSDLPREKCAELLSKLESRVAVHEQSPGREGAIAAINWAKNSK
jgi:epoxyqueuosine reductase